MKKLFYYADRYLQKSDWRDMAMLKFCLFSMGVLAGMQIPERNKKRAGAAALFVLIVTYVPLMAKFAGVVMEKKTSRL